MPSSKHSRKSRKTKSFQYGHKYRSLEICEGDTSTAAGLKACIRRLKWMNDDFLYRVDKEGKRGKMKNKKALNLCLETQCDDRIKELAKCDDRMDRILHEYLTRFFPGNEEKAMDLGILKVDNMQGKDAFRKQKKKENDEMLSFI
eukprot:155949_1